MIPTNDYLDEKWENIASSSEIRVTDESFGVDVDAGQTSEQTSTVDSSGGGSKREIAAAAAAVGLGYTVMRS